MTRIIDITYKLNDDKTLLTIDITDESDNNITRYLKEYNLIEIDEPMLLYNQMLEDFGAEYDDDLASTLDKIVNKIEKEGANND